MHHPSAPLAGHARRPASTEREGEGLHTRSEKFNVEGPIPHVMALSHQLVEPVRRDGTEALTIGIRAVIVARRLAIDQNAKPHWVPGLGRPENEVQIAGVYRSCDVLALTSETEAWALVVNEALAAGLAVVTSDVVGAADDLVRPGINGRTCRSGNVESLREALLEVGDRLRRNGDDPCREYPSIAGTIVPAPRPASPYPPGVPLPAQDPLHALPALPFYDLNRRTSMPYWRTL